jgi:putative FmdB family regulatory protein
MIFDYRCKSCKKSFQLDVPITSKIEGRKHVKAKCPNCGSKKVEKLIHRPEIRFVGVGWGKDKTK